MDSIDGDDGNVTLPSSLDFDLENFTTFLFNAPTAETGINSYYFYETEQFTMLWILFVLIVMGNSGVLMALLVSKQRKSRMNFFIMQLALADLTVGLINVLTDIVWRITIEWHAGNFACKFIRFMQTVVTYASTYVLVALTIDRYDAITHPMNFSGSRRRARILVGGAWALSVLFSVPIFVMYEEKRVQGVLQCWIEFGHIWQWQVYMTLVAVALVVAPTLLISACYAVIVATIWSKSKALLPPNAASRHRRHPARDHRVHRPLDDGDGRRASSRGLIPKAKIKTVKMTFVIVFVFVVCWSPYMVFDLLQVYGFVPHTQTTVAIASFIQSLAPLNSAANPIIYCLFSTPLCRIVRQMPPFSWCCPQSASRPGTSRTTETVSCSATESNVASLRASATLRRAPLRDDVVTSV